MKRYSRFLVVALAGVYAWCIYASPSLYAPSRLILFTLLMLVLAGLHWRAPETGGMQFLYFVVQGGLTFAVVLLVRNQEAPLVLYLMLVGEAAGTIENPGLIFAVAGTLALYAVNFVLLWGWAGLPGGLAVAVPLALFLLAFGERSRHQARTRQREEAFVRQVEAIHQPEMEDGNDIEPAQSGPSRRLAEALMKEIIRFRSTTGVRCSLDLYPLPDLPEPLRECILQTVVNGLSNIAQYAQASDVYIRVIPSEEWVEVEVLDNGIGFDPLLAAGPLKHYGMLGLQERAQLEGGTLEITSKPGQGTTVLLRLPLGR